MSSWERVWRWAWVSGLVANGRAWSFRGRGVFRVLEMLAGFVLGYLVFGGEAW